MSMTVQTLRDYVLRFLDTDSEDLPDELLDVFMQEAIDQIARASQKWSFYEAEFEVTTVAAQREYALHGASGVADTLSSLHAIQGEQYALSQIGHADARNRWGFTTSTREPTHFSVWADSLWLWPLPDAAYDLTLIGYRKPVAPPGTSSSPDFPEEFHPIVAKWMLAMAYQQQDDTSSSQILLSEASQQLENIRSRYETVQRGGPAVLGGFAREPWPNTLGRPPYDWE